MANPAQESERDLGLSGRVAQSRQERIMRPDGTVNVVRLGESRWHSLSLYQHMLRVTWPRFFLYVLLFYIAANLLFASLYMAAGPGAIQGGETEGPNARWHNAIFFSVQTIATIGYGQMTPKGTMANTLVALEALTGLMGFALITGILFARFSRPTADVLRSNVALIAPYRGGRAVMFRIANGRQSHLIELKATVTYSRMEIEPAGRTVRRFYSLGLERESVVLLPTQWVVVHPITERSPIYGQTEEQLRAGDPEIFVTITALEETFSQPVHARFSYADEQIIYGARFSDPFGTTAGGVVTINLRGLSDYEKVELP